VIFTEPQLNTQLAQVVGRETGVPVVEIDALGGVPGRMSYAELILFDVGVITRTLGGGRK
jgi:hypothetical protein